MLSMSNKADKKEVKTLGRTEATGSSFPQKADPGLYISMQATQTTEVFLGTKRSSFPIFQTYHKATVVERVS